MKHIFIKAIVNVLNIFSRLALLTSFVVASVYAVANALIYAENHAINSILRIEHISYLPFSFFYQSALKLLSELTTGLCVLFIFATAFSIAFEYVMAKYKFQPKEVK